MNKQLLIHKYNPKHLDEFIGNDEVKLFLKNMIQCNCISFILLGSQGYGKTSFLEAFVNDYFKGHNITNFHNNVLYINQFKEQGIHFFKNEVKHFCKTHSLSKHIKKILVLDNLDSIPECSQYIIQYLIDKYSHQILFIASACSQQKILSCLQSRMISHTIQYPRYQDLFNYSKIIIDNEKILITKDCIIDKIVTKSDYSFRKLINLLDKVHLLGEEINEEIISDICSDINDKLYDTIIENLRNGMLGQAIHTIHKMTYLGYSNIDIYDNFYHYIKNSDLEECVKLTIIPIICEFITNFYNYYEDHIELVIFTNKLYKILRLK